VDAIVVLGRGAPFARPRVNLAAELWQNQRAPVIFVSGRGDASDLIKQLEEKGIPERSLDGEECSVTTWENAIFTTAILQPQGIRRILLITDALHMWRSLLVFRAQGFDVIPRISPIDFYFVGKRGKSFLALREYSGLVEYGLRGLYFRKHSSELNNPELENLVQKAQRYGQQQQLKPE
ncbi:MAG TPA: YdcF family protein, partial [Coleofasciculaceae cyanobacterium]